MKLTTTALILIIILFLTSTKQLLGFDDNAYAFSWSQLTTEPTIGLDWSSDGAFLVTGLFDTSEIVVLDWQSGEVKQRLSFPGQTGAMDLSFSARWSPDAQSITTFDRMGNLYILDLQMGELLLLKEPREEYRYVAVVWSPDSTSVAALSSNGFIDIISLQTSEVMQTIDIVGSDSWRGESSLYSSFDWSPDGNLFAAQHQMKDIAGEPPVMGFWGKNGALLEAYTSENLEDNMPNPPCPANAFLLQYVYSVQWANDSRTLAVSGNEGYGVCRLNIDGTIDQYLIPDGYATTLRWSPDQKWLAASRRIDGSCSVWLSVAAQNYQTVAMQVDTPPCSINALAWSPDSQHLAVSTNKGIWIGTLMSS